MCFNLSIILLIHSLVPYLIKSARSYFKTQEKILTWQYS